MHILQILLIYYHIIYYILYCFNHLDFEMNKIIII